MPSPLYPAKGSSKRTIVWHNENTTPVPAASVDILSQEITLHFSSPAQPFCSRPLANLQEECRLGPLHSPWQPPRHKHVTEDATQELPRTEMRSTAFQPDHHLTRSLQTIQPTGHSESPPTQRASTARTSDLT